MFAGGGSEGPSHDWNKRPFASCDKISLFDLSEYLFEAPNDRRPFVSLCGLMRRCSAKTIYVREHIQKSEEFVKDEFFKPAKDEIEALRKITNLNAIEDISLTQVAFFHNTIDPKTVALPSQTRNEDLLGTCLVVHVNKSGHDDTGQEIRSVHSYVFRAVIALPTISTENGAGRLYPHNCCYHIGDDLVVFVHRHKFTLHAPLYCQQNGLNAFCGQTALSMSFRHVFKDESYAFKDQRRTHLPVSLFNEITQSSRPSDEEDNDSSNPPKFVIDDIFNICEKLDVETIGWDCDRSDKATPYELAYMLIESGIPTVLAFVSDRDDIENNGIEREICHVLPVVGHTWDSSAWLPWAAREYDKMDRIGFRGKTHDFRAYISSVEWVPQLIVHDDLLGPYMHVEASSFAHRTCITTKKSIGITEKLNGYIKKLIGCSEKPSDLCKEPIGRIKYVIGFVSKEKGFTESPCAVQEVAAGYLRGLWEEDEDENGNTHWQKITSKIAGRWKERLSNQKIGEFNLVLRTQIIDRSDYIRHLAKDVQNQSQLQEGHESMLKEQLQEKLWMVEFSMPELFSVRGRKLGECLLPCPLPEKYVNALNCKCGGKGPALPLLRLANYASLSSRDNLDMNCEGHTPLYRRIDRPNMF